jgi:predicted metalloprotease with PDZ domain
MELTNGKKDLLDIILALRNKYGPNKSFKDSDIIAEFVSMSDPALQTFFDRYITGREDLPIKEYLHKVGIEYDRSFKGEIVVDPLKDNDVKRSRIARKGRYTIKKVGKNDEIGLQEGDLLTSYNDKLQNEFGYVSKDEVIQLEVQRSGADIILPYSIKTTTGVKSHYIRFMKTPTKEQLRLQSLWLNSTEKE